MASPAKRSRLSKAFFGGGTLGEFQDIADAKERHMTVNSLERIMGEFPEALECHQAVVFEDKKKFSFP